MIGAQHLATTMKRRAPGIVKATLDRLGSADRTIATSIVVTRFVDACAASAASDDWAALAVWADATCERYAGVLAAPGAIFAALDGVQHALRSAADEATSRAFASARLEIEEVIARPRDVAGPEHHEAVDEIDVILDDLLSQLDQSDVLTAEHSRAVSSWCSRLAKRMGSSKEQIVHLSRAGLIHDIGKITTPLEILTAPRVLTDEEFAVMRRHSEAGAMIVREIPLIANLTPAVLSHHERFDGSGYPERLKSEAIPHVARIVAVADAFNAMIGRRPYRPPLAPSVALDRLVAGRGEQFDPDVVDAMIDVVTNNA
jgi:putative nucleotidyltransferase with HDIG domain